MEIVLLLVGLCVLGILANHFGADSRPGITSSEHFMAAHGLVWNGSPIEVRHWPAPQPANGVVTRPAAAHPLRHRLAAALYRLADWLHPDAREPRHAAQRSTSI